MLGSLLEQLSLDRSPTPRSQRGMGPQHSQSSAAGVQRTRLHSFLPTLMDLWSANPTALLTLHSLSSPSKTSNVRVLVAQTHTHRENKNGLRRPVRLMQLPCLALPCTCYLLMEQLGPERLSNSAQGAQLALGLELCHGSSSLFAYLGKESPRLHTWLSVRELGETFN